LTTKHDKQSQLIKAGFFRNLTLIIGVVYLISFSVQAQKNDTVYLFNGDRITGEVKKFEYGILFFKTDAMQTVSIEYDKIKTVYSGKYFEIRSITGYQYYGSLLNSENPMTVNIITRFDTVSKPFKDIVQITSIKQTLIQKIDGSIDLGLRYTKASDVFQYNLAVSVAHRASKIATKFDLSSILTDQKEIDVTRKNDIGLNVTYYLPKKWFSRFEVKGQENTELDLRLRMQAGCGAGYDLVRNNLNRLYGIAGLLVNHEKTIDSSLVSNNVEGLLAMQYKWFQYRHPKIDVTTGFNFYPSFTIPGRIRFEYNLEARFEIITDLFFGISLYENYDSKISGSESAKNDWGVITSIGFTF